MFPSLKATRPAAATAALILAMALAAGCGSIPETHYYTIGRIIPRAPTSSSKLDITVGVARFEADGIYERDNLLYRRGSYEIAVDYYRRWGMPPQTMLAEATIEYVRAAGLFDSVLRMPTMSACDAILTGRILRFEETGSEVQVALEFTLQSTHGNKILWQGEVSSSAPVTVAASPEARISATEARISATEACLADCLGSLISSLSSADLALY